MSLISYIHVITRRGSRRAGFLLVYKRSPRGGLDPLPSIIILITQSLYKTTTYQETPGTTYKTFKSTQIFHIQNTTSQNVRSLTFFHNFPAIMSPTKQRSPSYALPAIMFPKKQQSRRYVLPLLYSLENSHLRDLGRSYMRIFPCGL
jgi:hypothetical protein